MTNQQNLKDFSWSRLLGLIQSDGHLRFELTSGTFNPRVFISVTEKRRSFLNKIKSFLMQEGLVVQDEPSKIKKGETWARGTNLLIERQRNFESFLEKIKPLEESTSTPISLLDYKKRDLELLKQAFELNKQKQGLNDPEGKRSLSCKILDIKEEMYKFHTGKRVLTPEKTAALLKVTDLTLVKGAATSIVASCERKTEVFQTKLLNDSSKWETINDVTPEVGGFLAGVFEGDGCFQLKLDCQDPDKNKGLKRPLVNITPLITLSNQKQGLATIDPVFLLANNVFRKGKPLAIHSKQSSDALDWTCSAAEDIEQRVIPFFNKFGFCSEYALARFELMTKFVAQQETILKNEEAFKSFVQELYSNPYFYHERPIEEVFKVIGKHFDFERKKNNKN